MVGSSVLLFILIIIVVLFRTYVYLCHHRRHRQFSQQSLTTTTFKEEGLDPSVLKSIPTFMFSSSATRRALHDCAVCLSEFTDGDVCRTLPNCNHDFHSQCIDMWLGSHSNCPLCRTPVQPTTVHSRTEPGAVSGSEEPGEGCSNFLEPVGCPRKPFSVVVELPPPEIVRVGSRTRR
jgi:hypothetical protein